AVREQSAHIAEMAREQARANAEVAREQARAAADMAREQARMGIGYAYSYAPLARLATPTPNVNVNVAPVVIGRATEDLHFARPYFIQGDPADSLYRLALDALNRGDFGRAAQMFRDVAQRFPNSGYQKDFPYWEAVARYRIGTTTELETAAR